MGGTFEKLDRYTRVEPRGREGTENGPSGPNNPDAYPRIGREADGTAWPSTAWWVAAVDRVLYARANTF